METTLAVEAHGLVRRFGDFTAVDGVDLAVPAGSFYGFLGPNGAGKSTTIKCLTGLLQPTAGTLRLLGLDPLADPVDVRRRVGVVPEGLALLERLSAAEMLDFVGQVHGLPLGERGRRRDELLALMDLTDTGDTLVADFSHGMRKKLALAAALLPGPKLLFLDEPFEGVDAVAARQFKELLTAYVRRGNTVFLTSHVLEIVERLCDRVAVIARGRIVAEGRTDELRADSGGGRSLEQVFVELVGGERAAAHLDWL
ncbi:MAG: ABC transporter ATP-binding protein [Vicinamibacteria bacterium]|nr:ABC transporter ATP-binding protein [Vicinamibacteria bacterium]